MGIATTMIVLSIILNLAILIDPEEEVITNNLKMNRSLSKSTDVSSNNCTLLEHRFMAKPYT